MQTRPISQLDFLQLCAPDFIECNLWMAFRVTRQRHTTQSVFSQSAAAQDIRDAIKGPKSLRVVACDQQHLTDLCLADQSAQNPCELLR